MIRGRFSRVSLAFALVSGAPSVSQAQGTATPPNCDAPEYGQFTFWVGDWNVTGLKGEQLGTNRVSLEENGCLIHEHWVGTGGSTGQSFNFYDRSDGRWHQIWVSNDGETLLMTGKLVGNELTYTMERPTGKGVTVNHRLSFTRNADGSVHQFWQISTDHGKTWRVAFDGLYRKKGAP